MYQAHYWGGDYQDTHGGVVCVYGAPKEINSDEDVRVRSDTGWYKRVPTKSRCLRGSLTHTRATPHVSDRFVSSKRM